MNFFPKSTTFSKSGLIFPAIFVSLLAPVAGQASLLYGVLNTGGSVNISLGRIDFTGPFTVSNTSSGGFAPLGNPIQTFGTSMNIDNPPYTVDTLVSTPNFLTLAAAPNISFTLTELLSGTQGSAGCSGPAVAGQNCTPTVPVLSPFNLSNTTNATSTASFVVLGFEVDSLTGSTTPFTGIYTQQFAMPFQSLVSQVSSGATLSTSYSATFITSVPEPNSGLMFGGGAGLLASIMAYWVRRSSVVGQKTSA